MCSSPITPLSDTLAFGGFTEGHSYGGLLRSVKASLSFHFPSVPGRGQAARDEALRVAGPRLQCPRPALLSSVIKGTVLDFSEPQSPPTVNRGSCNLHGRGRLDFK